MVAPIGLIGMPWYRREVWPALRELLVDADLLHTKWEDWQRAAVLVEYELRQRGKRVVRAEIRPEPFAAWCTNLGIAADANARNRWTSEAAYRETRQQN